VEHAPDVDVVGELDVERQMRASRLRPRAPPPDHAVRRARTWRALSPSASLADSTARSS